MVDRTDGFGGHKLAVLEHGHAVAKLENLIEPVRNVDDRHTIVLERPQAPEQELDFLAGDDGSRLIEDEKLHLVHKRFGDFDHLLVGDAQLGNTCVRINLNAEALQQIDRVLPLLSVIKQTHRSCGAHVR